MQPEGQDPYDDLPLAIKQYYTREEYLWLSDEEKSDLLRSMCEPEE